MPINVLQMTADELQKALGEGDLNANEIEVLMQFGQIKLSGYRPKKPPTSVLGVRIPLALRRDIDTQRGSEPLTAYVIRVFQAEVKKSE